jgi:tRNA pseudouridine55 synthase
MDGAIILDKAAGSSSHAAVQAVRRLLSEPRIGHLGTLDPFATGVLVLLLGRATRLARFYRDREKTYQGAIRFGYSTDTYDCTGTPASPDLAPTLDADQMRRLFLDLTGTYLQQPPPISAKKVGGVPAYRLTRKGREPSLESVPVTVQGLELLSIDGSTACFRVRVSSGTYIRSLAHEMGKRMGTGAHLAQLRRTAAGEFAEAAAVPFKQLEERVLRGEIPLIPAEALLPEFPALTPSPSAASSVSHGNDLTLQCSAKWVRLLDDSGKLQAVAERVADDLYHPVVVFNESP